MGIEVLKQPQRFDTDVTMLQSLSVGGRVTASSMLVTHLTAVSATISNIDIRQYELSGYTVDGDFTVTGLISATNTVVTDTISAANFEITDAPIGPGTSFNKSMSTFLVRLDGEWFGLPLVDPPQILLYNNELVLYDNFILNYNG